jgi:arylsulfatase
MPQREWLNQPEVLRKINEENSSVDHDSVSWRENPSPEDVKKMRAQYFGNVTMIDEKIGQILEALDKKGYLENSVVIFTSDHGDCLGDHGHSQKWSMFEQIVRVPMILWSPQMLKGRRGRQIDALCQHFDMAHTLLELAGVDIPPYFESRSLLPFLEGRENKGREYVFCEQGEDSRLRYGGCRQITMVRNHEWKLVHYLGTSEGELYHLTKDPGEHRNLWNQPDYKEIKADLKDRLLEWSMESSLKTEGWKNPIR